MNLNLDPVSLSESASSVIKEMRKNILEPRISMSHLVGFTASGSNLEKFLFKEFIIKRYNLKFQC